MAQGVIHCYNGCVYESDYKTFMVGCVGVQGTAPDSLGVQGAAPSTTLPSTPSNAGVAVYISLNDGSTYGPLEQFLNNYKRTHPDEPLMLPTKWLKTEVVSKTIKKEKEFVVFLTNSDFRANIDRIQHLLEDTNTRFGIDTSDILESVDDLSSRQPALPDDCYDIVTKQTGYFEVRCLEDGPFYAQFIKNKGYEMFGEFEIKA